MILEADIFTSMAETQHRNVSFPLTPALSPGERENSASLIGETRASFGFSMLKRAFPLPAGEGQGEGNRDSRNPDGTGYTEAIKALSKWTGISSFSL